MKNPSKVCATCTDSPFFASVDAVHVVGRPWTSALPDRRRPIATGHSGAGRTARACPAPRRRPPNGVKRRTSAGRCEVPGRGSATPVVWGDRLYVLTAVPAGVAGDAQHAALRRQAARRAQVTWCWRSIARRGKIDVGARRRAKRRRTKRRIRRTARGRRPRPSSDGEHVIASFESRGCYAYDMNGKLVWQKDLGDKRMRNTFGEGSTPALHGNTLVVVWDHQGESFVAALDKRTGDEIWRKARTEIDTWATPLVTPVNGKPQVIVPAMNKIMSYDLATGDVVWESAGLTMNAIPTPVHRRHAGVPHERLPRQQPQGDPAGRRERRHHRHAGGGVDARSRHAVRALAAALRRHSVFPEDATTAC